MGRANILLPSHHCNLDKPATVAGAPHGGSPGSIQNQLCTGFAAATDRKLTTGDAAIRISMTLWSALLVMCAPQAALGVDDDQHRYNRCCNKCKALHHGYIPLRVTIMSGYQTFAMLWPSYSRIPPPLKPDDSSVIHTTCHVKNFPNAVI